MWKKPQGKSSKIHKATFPLHPWNTSPNWDFIEFIDELYQKEQLEKVRSVVVLDNLKGIVFPNFHLIIMVSIYYEHIPFLPFHPILDTLGFIFLNLTLWVINMFLFVFLGCPFLRGVDTCQCELTLTSLLSTKCLNMFTMYLSYKNTSIRKTICIVLYFSTSAYDDATISVRL